MSTDLSSEITHSLSSNWLKLGKFVTNLSNNTESAISSLSDLSLSLMKSKTTTKTKGRKVEKEKEKAEEVLKELEGKYYEEQFDPVRQMLNDIPIDVEQAAITEKMEKMEAIMNVLDEKLNTAIQKNSDGFVQGMKHIQDVEMDLTMASLLCKNSKRIVSNADEEIVESIFKTISKVKRRRHFMEVISMLNEIRNIIDIENKIKHLLSQGDFTQAMELHIQGHNMLPSLERFTCMTELRSRFRNGQADIRAQMYSESKLISFQFNLRKFQNVAKVFILLEDPQELATLFKKVYLECVDETTSAVVAKFIKQDTAKLGAKDLVSLLPTDSFLTCLNEIIHSTSKVLFSYQSVCNYLGECAPDENDLKKSVISISSQPAPFELTPSIVSMLRDAKSVFLNFRKGVWERAQQRITLLLNCNAASCLSNGALKVTELLQVLNNTDKFIAVGECFAHVESSQLSQTIYQKSKEYFDTIHRETFEICKQHLEMDSWNPVVVPINYSLRDMAEFRQSKDVLQAKVASATHTARLGLGLVSANDRNTLFLRFASGEDLFMPVDANAIDDAALKARLSQFDEWKAAEEEIASRAEVSSRRKIAPIVTQSSLQIIKRMGRYIGLMESLSPIANDAFNGIVDLFDIYFYTVLLTFGNDSSDLFNLNAPASNNTVASALDDMGNKADEMMSMFKNVSKLFDSDAPITRNVEKDELRESLNSLNLSELRAALISIKDKVQTGAMSYGIFTQTPIENKGNKNKPLITTLSPLIRVQSNVELNERSTSFGLRNRCTAIESISFMIQVLKDCEFRLKSSLPIAIQQRASSFLLYAENIYSDLRSYMYRSIARKMLDFDSVFNSFAKCKWDSRDISSQTNNYVDILIGQFQQIDSSIQEGPNQDAVPSFIQNIIWKEISTITQEELVEAYAHVKKCSFEGRAGMSMDTNTIKKELDTIVKTKIDFSHVLNFITGFYCDEAQFLKFIVEKPNYKYQHYLNLAELGPLKDAEIGRKKQYINNIRVQYGKNIEAERASIKNKLEERKHQIKKSLILSPNASPPLSNILPSIATNSSTIKLVDISVNKNENKTNDLISKSEEIKSAEAKPDDVAPTVEVENKGRSNSNENSNDSIDIL